jgi:hypothetical protein
VAAVRARGLDQNGEVVEEVRQEASRRTLFRMVRLQSKEETARPHLPPRQKLADQPARDDGGGTRRERRARQEATASRILNKRESTPTRDTMTTPNAALAVTPSQRRQVRR